MGHPQTPVAPVLPRRSRGAYARFQNHMVTCSEFHLLPRVGPKQLCAVAHLGCTRAAGTSYSQKFQKFQKSQKFQKLQKFQKKPKKTSFWRFMGAKKTYCPIATLYSLASKSTKILKRLKCPNLSLLNI